MRKISCFLIFVQIIALLSSCETIREGYYDIKYLIMKKSEKDQEKFVFVKNIIFYKNLDSILKLSKYYDQYIYDSTYTKNNLHFLYLIDKNYKFCGSEIYKFKNGKEEKMMSEIKVCYKNIQIEGYLQFLFVEKNDGNWYFQTIMPDVFY